MSSKPRFVGEKVPFADAFTEVSRGTKKFKQSEYAEIGAHPIVDQGKEAIAGYSDEENGLFTDVPAIVFGDHTRCVKYVEEPFFAGADGVKILKPKLPGSTRFWWHALRATPIEDLGYSRHFKLLKAATFKVVNEARQEEVVACLDGVLEQISYAEDQLTGFDSLVKSRFVEMFEDCSEHVALGDVCSFKSGKTLPKSKEMPAGDYLYAKVGDLNLPGNERSIRFSRAYVDAETAKKWLIPKGAVVFPKRGGAIGTNKKRIVGEDCCLDLNLMSVIPGDKICTEYLLAWFDQMDLAEISNGSAVPQINNKDLDPLIIPLPQIRLQHEFSSFVQQVDKSGFAS